MRWMRAMVLVAAVMGVGRAIGGLPPFEGSGDVGAVGSAGSAEYDYAAGQYRIRASGENMWGQKDAFHFAWKKISGDAEMACAVRFEGGGHEHRKAGWMVRQDLSPEAAYVDAVVHADGLTSMQYRRQKGGPTEEVQAVIKNPAAVRLCKDGNVYSMYVSREGKDFEPVGSVIVELSEPVYAGLAACSHDNAARATAVLKDVSLSEKGTIAETERMIESTLEIMDIETGERRVLWRDLSHFEAPNWSRDGKYLLYNSGGKLYTIDAGGGTPQLLDTKFADRCNNDHGFSPEGKLIALSHQDEKDNISRIYIVDAAGGVPRLVTQKGPSYWHGWSPDGVTLAYCAERNGKFDIYTIGDMGWPEKRLTDAEGLDDGPDYAPDGNIFFNSERTGAMRIWRMEADGGDQRQVTFDEAYGDWFPHPSPDGKRIVFLSYDASVQGHPANKEVVLRLMELPDGKPRILARLFGGQGTLNVNSWAPDGKRFAFVSYRLIQTESAGE